MATEQLFVYNNGTQHRFSTSNSVIRLSETVIPSSIVVMGSSGETYPFTLEMPNGFDGEQGSLVNVISDNGQKTTIGEIKSIDTVHKTVTLTTSVNDITVMNPEFIMYVNQSVVYPTITINKFDFGTTFYVSYLSVDVSWKPMIVATIGVNEMKLNISALVTNLNETRSNVDLTLSTGAITEMDGRAVEKQIVSYDYDASSTSEFKTADIVASPVTRTLLRDYITFPLREVKLLAKNSRRNIFPLESVVGVKISKVNFSSTSESGPVQYGYLFQTPVSLPSGSVSVYSSPQDSTSGVGRYLGTSRIQSAIKGSEVRLLVGYSSLISCEYTIQRKVKRSVDKEFEGASMSKTNSVLITVMTTNNSDGIEPIYISHYVGNRVISNFQTKYKANGDYIEFVVNAKKGNSTVTFVFDETVN